MQDKMKKLAVLRGDGVGRPCPYGLSIPIACKNAGDSVFSMVPLADVPEDDRDQQKQANRRIYRHSNDGAKCPFLEGVVKAAKYDTVNCDAEDSNPGAHETPFRASPYYPRIGAGFNVNVLYGYGFQGYNDSGQDSYMNSSFVRPAMIEGGDFWLVDGELEKEAGDLEKNLAPANSSELLAELGPPSAEQYSVFVFDIGRLGISTKFEAQTLESARDLAAGHVGPGKKIEIEGLLLWKTMRDAQDDYEEPEVEEDLIETTRVAPRLAFRDDKHLGTEAIGR